MWFFLNERVYHGYGFYLNSICLNPPRKVGNPDVKNTTMAPSVPEKIN